jgi:hypothetical protein
MNDSAIPLSCERLMIKPGPMVRPSYVPVIHFPARNKKGAGGKL